MRAFEIAEDILALEALLMEVDEETGEFIHSEDDVKEFVQELKKNKEVKLNNIQDFKLSNNGSITALDEKIKKLQARKKSLDNLNARLSDIQEMLLDGEKFKTTEYTFSYRKSSSVVVSNADDILDKYFKIEKKPILKDIKEAILLAEKNKETFFGAEIVAKTSLSIR